MNQAIQQDQIINTQTIAQLNVTTNHQLNLSEIDKELSDKIQQQIIVINQWKSQKLAKLNETLQYIGDDFFKIISEEVNSIITNDSPEFEIDFKTFHTQIMSSLEELIKTFSVAEAYRKATQNHPRHSTAPLLAVLVEAIYYMANKLEIILVESIKQIIINLFKRLLAKIFKTSTTKQIKQLLGNDGGVKEELIKLEPQITQILVSATQIECDRFLRETPQFYDQPQQSLQQFGQILKQTSLGYDLNSIMIVEPHIKELLKAEFTPKVSNSIRQNLRHILNQTIKSHLLPMAEKQANHIANSQQIAEQYLTQRVEMKLTEIAQEMTNYNQLTNNINQSIALN